MKLHGSPTLEPGRPVYVLMHKDQTHVASLPDGTADWSYNKSDMELRLKILTLDFSNNNYVLCTALQATTLISNKQAELEDLWEPVLKEIRKTPKLRPAWELYAKALKKLGPHPLRFDAYLKQKLRI
jgi:hypothetical protein